MGNISITSSFHDLLTSAGHQCAAFLLLLNSVRDTSQPLCPLGQIHFIFFCLRAERELRLAPRTTDHMWPEEVSQVVSS